MPGTPLPRTQFPVVTRYAYLNHAGIGSLPSVATDAIIESAAAFRDEAGLAYDRYDLVMEQARVSAAQLMGVPTVDVAFVKNTTEGIALSASGIDWQPGDRVIVPNYEFPSNFYPWIALRDRGVQVDVIEPVGPHRELPIELFEAALAEGPTRVVAVSWVQFGYGWRTDLASLGALCREHDALFCVDAIQGLGVLPASFEAWGVDVAASDGHKWLLGPNGIGVAYISPRAREQLRPLQAGWASVPYREDWDNLELRFDDSARRYEGGSYNVITIAGLGASIDLLLAAGIDNVWAHVDGLCQRLAAGLDDLGADVKSVHEGDGRSSIASFTLPGVDTDDIVVALEAANVITQSHAGAVRVSPHGYNTVDEIDTALAVIAKLI